MSETYGFSKVSSRVLKSDLTPDTTKKIRVMEGVPTEGGPTSFELTGLSKEAVKVFAGNREYYISAKGTGSVAANFGLLDVPAEIERELLGLITFGEGIDAFGENTEPPYIAVVAESEDLSTGDPLLSQWLVASLIVMASRLQLKTMKTLRRKLESTYSTPFLGQLPLVRKQRWLK